MCEILVDMGNLFKIYIHPPIGQQLLFIIERLKDLIGIQQITNVIDDTHVPLSFQPSNKIMVSLGDFTTVIVLSTWLRKVFVMQIRILECMCSLT